jgi:hypothetical protein
MPPVTPHDRERNATILAPELPRIPKMKVAHVEPPVADRPVWGSRTREQDTLPPDTNFGLHRHVSRPQSSPKVKVEIARHAT